MSDLISRQAAIERLKKHGKVFCKNHMEFTILSDKDKARVDEIDNAIATLVNLPSAQQRKTGQWIKRKKGAIGYNCSCCGKSDISNHFDYCPNCGARMERRKDAKDAVGN